MILENKRYFAILAILLIYSCQPSKQLAQNKIDQGHWMQINAQNSHPVKRSEAAFIGVKDELFLLGGRGIYPISIYNIKTNTWSEGAKSPIEMHHFQPIVYKDEIYVVGAMTGQYPGEIAVREIHVYNPKSNSWRTEGLIPASRARGGAGIVVSGDILYMVCGIKDGHRGDHKNWLDSYNFKTKKWTILPDAPLARDHFQAGLVNGKIYSVGGRTTISSDNPFKHTIGQVDVFDIDNKRWSSMSQELPTWRAGNALLVHKNEIIILGGESITQTPAHSEVEVLDTKTNTWRSLPSIPVGRHGTGLVEYKGAWYTASGSGNRGGGPELDDLWKFEF